MTWAYEIAFPLKTNLLILRLDLLLIGKHLDSLLGSTALLLGLLRWWRICLPSRRWGFDLWVGKIPGEGNANPLQYSCLGNPMRRGAWQVTVHGVTRIGHDWATERLSSSSSSASRFPFHDVLSHRFFPRSYSCWAVISRHVSSCDFSLQTHIAWE